MIDFTGKWFYIAGVANKKSVAAHVAQSLIKLGAKVIFSAQNEKNRDAISTIFPDSPSFILDVENIEQIQAMSLEIKKYTDRLDGFLHSIAFANFDLENSLFHKTKRADFLQACQISCFSLVEMANALKDILSPDASVVTVSISSTRVTSYGYLGPIKAMLETTIPYLAKSFSGFSQIRFNSVAAGPLKTSASAGIPGYVENYLFAEKLTLRKKALQTQEVANSIVFLLSSQSTGINASNMVIDAGMNCNYFDQEIVLQSGV